MRIRLDTLSAYHKHGYDLELWCRACGHKVIVTPEWFFARGILGSVAKLERRLRCSQCKARRTAISSTMSGPSGGLRRGSGAANANVAAPKPS
jgi:hypothetical protein